MRLFKKHPRRFQAVVIFAVLVEAIILQVWFPETWAGWGSVELDTGRRELLTGTLAAAAIVTGFSGVISVFGLSADSDAFVKFRVRAGAPLRTNWAAVSQAGLMSMAFALSAAILDTFGQSWVSIYFFQLAAVFLIENGFRSLWLLGKLVTVNDATDKARYKELTE